MTENTNHDDNQTDDDNQNDNEEMTMEQALQMVAASAAARVRQIEGDPLIFENKDEVHRHHMAAVALIERSLAGDNQAVAALLPPDYMSGLSQVLALAAVGVYLARAAGDPAQVLADARASLLARLAQGDQ